MIDNNIIALSFILLLAACSGSGESAREHNDPTSSITKWQCGDGIVLSIRWDKEWAYASMDGRRWRLQRALSGSGARYASNGREIWEHQGKVRWTDINTQPLICLRIS